MAKDCNYGMMRSKQMDDHKDDKSEDQTTDTSQEKQDPFKLGGIYLRGTREIARHMGVSPATICRWRRRFRGREDILLCFPGFELPTGIGGRWNLFTNTALINAWMERWVQIDGAKLREKEKWKRRPPKVKRIGETSKRPGAPIEGKGCEPVREEPPAEVESRPEPLATELPVPTVNQEPAPVPNRPENVIPEGCTCGNQTITCTAH
jgi:Homeodomain-like domain